MSEKVIRCIFSSNGGIRFCEPTQWNDKYESIFYRSEKYLSDDLKPNMVYASCFTTKRENEAAWYPAAGYREPQYGGGISGVSTCYWSCTSNGDRIAFYMQGGFCSHNDKTYAFSVCCQKEIKSI